MEREEKQRHGRKKETKKKKSRKNMEKRYLHLQGARFELLIHVCSQLSQQPLENQKLKNSVSSLQSSFSNKRPNLRAPNRFKYFPANFGFDLKGRSI